LRRGDFTPRDLISIAGIADIARDRKSKTAPRMNTDDTDQESVIGKAKPFNHKGHEKTQRQRSRKKALIGPVQFQLILDVGYCPRQGGGTSLQSPLMTLQVTGS
jgi:hypothetical protein